MQQAEIIQTAAGYIQSALSCPHPAGIGIVLGTGLGDWAASLPVVQSFDYKDIPGFPRSTVHSHAGKLMAAMAGSVPVWIQQGRFHLYEGYSPAQVCVAVRTLAVLGVDRILITNAAGALNPQFEAGSLMLITDHINQTGQNPLCGPNYEPWGERFPDMSQVYSMRLRSLALDIAQKEQVGLERGVYAGVMGPCLETPAETRALRILGADAVGMSTVLEVIAARHMGLEVLGLSCLTNKNLPDCMQETSLDDVIEQAGLAAGDLKKLLDALVPLL